MKSQFLFEDNDPNISPEESLDAQVLRFFTKAEKLSIGVAAARNPLDDVSVEESLRLKSMNWLFEAAPEEEEDDEPDRPEMNLESFASEVARLIENADVLLDIKGTILEMAHNYIQNAHGDDVAADFLEVMDTQYDVSNENKQDHDTSNNIAVGARTPSA